MNAPAESMNAPSSAASDKYSGQCSRSERIIFLIGRANRANPYTLLGEGTAAVYRAIAVFIDSFLEDDGDPFL